MRYHNVRVRPGRVSRGHTTRRSYVLPWCLSCALYHTLALLSTHGVACCDSPAAGEWCLRFKEMPQGCSFAFYAHRMHILGMRGVVNDISCRVQRNGASQYGSWPPSSGTGCSPCSQLPTKGSFVFRFSPWNGIA